MLDRINKWLGRETRQEREARLSAEYERVQEAVRMGGPGTWVPVSRDYFKYATKRFIADAG